MLPRLPVGERVRDRRRRLGRTQAVLAGLCGITTDYLSQIERGLKTPSGDVLARLAAEPPWAPSSETPNPSTLPRRRAAAPV
ncbi:helix-turn-helix transcriptional regulator [Streptomyces cyaneofuscatus]|uniref:helix-turn-helix domain-containing protein n=1 Tax=Streptomyces cyaneofuscatus TaxID=66883 RepID=UPI002FEFA7B6